MRTADSDPFAALGLDRSQDLTGDDVRNAWRRIAAATHPDRPDGGDPGRFAAAAAAYSELRTAWGRGEARANLAADRQARVVAPASQGQGALIRLAACLAVAGALIAAALLAAGRGPVGPALVVGVLTWLALSLRRLLRAGYGVGPVATGRSELADHSDQEPT